MTKPASWAWDADQVVDDGHRDLAQAATFLVPLWEGTGTPAELINAVSAAAATGTWTTAGSPISGPAYRLDAAGEALNFANNTAFELEGDIDYSFWITFIKAGDSGEDNPSYLGQVTDYTQGAWFAGTLFGETGVAWRWLNSAGSEFTVGTFKPSGGDLADGLHTLAGSRVAGGTWRAWLDGTLTSGPTSQTATVSSGHTHQLHIGAAFGASELGDYALVVIWKGYALTQTDVDLLQPNLGFGLLEEAPSQSTVTSVNSDANVTEGDTGIVVAGTDFGASQGDGSVTINGVSATVTGWTATAVTITVPTVPTRTGNGLAEVIVTPDSGGASAADPFSFTLLSSDGHLGAIDADLGATILAHWTFNDVAASAVLLDRMGDNDGTYTNTPTKEQPALFLSSGLDAVEFDAASSEWAGVAHDAAFALAAGSISGVFKPTALADDSAVFAKAGTTPTAGDVELAYHTDGEITFTVYDGSQNRVATSGAGYVAAGQKVTYSVLWDGTGWELWLDGQQVGTPITAYTSGLTANSRAWRFARRGFSDSAFSDVILDDVIVTSTVPDAGDLLLLGLNGTAVGASLSTPYHIRSLAGQDLQLLWNVAASDDPTWTAAGLSFDGGDEVRIGTALATAVGGAHARTVIAVVKTNSSRGFGVQWREQPTPQTAKRWTLRKDGSTNKLRIEFSGSGYTVTGMADLPASGWVFIAATQSGANANTIVLYQDGESEACTQSTVLDTQGVFQVGWVDSGAVAMEIGYALVYDRALSAGEVEQCRLALRLIMAGRGVTLP